MKCYQYMQRGALLVYAACAAGCGTVRENRTSAPDLTSAVDPFIGVNGGGNTLPGPYLPFGMVRVGPDCGNLQSNSGYDGGLIVGFSQIHLSGAGGGPKYGNVLFRPTVGDLDVRKPAGNRRSESAKVGLYETVLDSGIKVELTAARRAAFHRYTFPKDKQGNVALDLGSILSWQGDAYNQKQSVLATETRIVTPNSVEGRVIAQGGWNVGSPYTVYFHAKLSRQPQGYGVWREGNTYPGSCRVHTDPKEHGGAFFTFDAGQEEQVFLKVGISYINCEKARKNLEEDIPQWDFAKVVANNRNTWNGVLGRVTIEGATQEQQTKFYTALYHSFSAPTDKTGDNPRWTSGEPYYDDFIAIWDTFRSTYPLFALLAPSRQRDLCRALVDIYRHDGWMPDARLGDDTGCVQGGSDCDIVIADCFVKGITGIDYETAYQAMVKNAEDAPGGSPSWFGENRTWGNCGVDAEHWGRGGVDEYIKLGYVPAEVERSGNRTMEYAACDFATAQVAKGLGKTADAAKYFKRAGNWRNLWQADKTEGGVTGFIIPRKRDGSFVANYGPGTGGTWPDGFYEGNSWIYSLYVPQDVKGLIVACGGKEKFIQRLDTYFAHQHQCENEPGFFSHCLYAYAGRPDKTAEATRRICQRFNNGRGGIPGNDDSGAMSAWLVFNMMGFYPNAGQDLHIITAPQLPKVIIHLENGKDFTLIAKNVSDTSIYVASATLNGKPLNRPWFRHGEIKNGATLEFQMSDKPTGWGGNTPPPPPDNHI